MEAIVLAVMSAAACVFLIYVYVNFAKELRLLRETRVAGSRVVPIGAHEEKTASETKRLTVQIRTHSASA